MTRNAAMKRGTDLCRYCKTPIAFVPSSFLVCHHKCLLLAFFGRRTGTNGLRIPMTTNRCITNRKFPPSQAGSRLRSRHQQPNHHIFAGEQSREGDANSTNKCTTFDPRRLIVDWGRHAPFHKEFVPPPSSYKTPSATTHCEPTVCIRI